MNAPAIQRAQSVATEVVAANDLPTELGAPFGGGFFVGVYQHSDERRALIVAPKDAGELKSAYHNEYKIIEGARSYFDGLNNTIAMAAEGSATANVVRATVINERDDWAIPARDQLEILYSAFKPTKQENACYFRDGENPSSLPFARYPYLPDAPLQTYVAAFQQGGAEAFADEWYWASTQYAGGGAFAWAQSFDDGNQTTIRKDYECRVRLVRSILVI